MNTQKFAFSYIRFSSSTQSKGSSLERQSPIAERVCGEQGWIYRPEWNAQNLGVSAFSGDNVKTIESIIAARKADKIPAGTVLILESLDRATRLELDTAMQLIRSILKSGLEIYTDMNKRHLTAESLNRATDVMLTAVELDAAFQYSHRLSERSNKGLDKKIAAMKRGEVITVGGQTPSFITGVKDGKFTVDNEKVKLIKRIFDEYADGKVLNKISTDLNLDVKRGLLPKSGLKFKTIRDWQPTTIKHVLTNPSYCGDFVFKGVTYKNYFPPIVKRDLWNKVQMMIKTNTVRRGGSPSGNVNGILKGIARCTCGARIHAVVTKQDGRIYNYSTCSSARLHNCTHGTEGFWLDTLKLEQDFCMLFLQQTPDSIIGKFTPKKQDESIALKVQIAEVEKSMDECAELIGSGLAVSAIRKKLIPLQAEKERLENELQKVQATTTIANAIPSSMVNIKKLLGDMTITKNMDKATIAFNKVAQRVTKSLQDTATRKQLVNLIPQLVKTVVVDLKKGGYSVINHKGEESKFYSLEGLPPQDRL